MDSIKKTEIVRVEWGSLIPALHDAHPTHLVEYDAGGHLTVCGGKILRKALYRQDVKPGGGWVTETSLGELRGNCWHAKSNNQNTDWTTSGNVKEVQIHADGSARMARICQGNPMCILVDTLKEIE